MSRRLVEIERVEDAVEFERREDGLALEVWWRRVSGKIPEAPGSDGVLFMPRRDCERRLGVEEDLDPA